MLIPPLNGEEATEAVNEMNGYQTRGRVGTRHTPQASLAHEEHHRRQWEDAYKFYWKDSKIQEMLENQTISCDKEPNMDKAGEVHAGSCQSKWHWIFGRRH